MPPNMDDSFLTESEVAKVIKNSKLTLGSIWYILPVKWFQAWNDYQASEKLSLRKELSIGGERPGPIDNSTIVTGSGQEVRKDCFYDQDYTAVPEKAWIVLVKLYGCSIVLRREVIVRGTEKKLSVEVHPLVFDLIKADLAGKAEIVSATDLLLSRNQTLTKLLEIVANQYKVAKSRIRLWSRPTSRGNELVGIDGNLQDLAGVEDSCEILVEELNANGKWPRDVEELSDNWRSQLAVGKRVKLHWDKSDESTDTWFTFDSDELQRYGTHVKQQSQFGRRYNSRNTRNVRAHTIGSPAIEGAVGLRNLGNTCFMNSILQCLSNCEPLSTFFLSGKYEDSINKDNKIGYGGRMTETYANLINAVWSGDYSVCVPAEFKKRIGEYNSSFAGYNQQDAQELMTFLLDGLHEDCNLIKKKPYEPVIESDGRPDEVIAKLAWDGHLRRNKSFITDTFFGQLRSHIKCNKCSRESITFDPYMTVSLPLPLPTTRPIEVTVVFKDPARPPLRCQPRVEIKNSTIIDLKHAVVVMSGISGGVDSLVCADMTDNLGVVRINTTRNNSEKCKRIRPRATTFIYELEMNQPDPYEGGSIRCRWNSMFYIFSISNLFIFFYKNFVPNKLYKRNIFSQYMYDSVNDDGTFEVQFADGDFNSNVEPGRLTADEWVNESKKIGMVELGSHKTALGSPGSRGESFGHTLVLVFPRRLWKYMQQYVKVGSGYNSQRLPFKLAIGSSKQKGYSSYSSRNSKLKEHVRFHHEFTFSHVVMHSSMPRRGCNKSSALNIASCFSAFAAEEQLDEQNEWYCNKCKKHVRAYKQLGLWSVPEIFIVGLKRFHYSQGWRKHSVTRDKISSMVDFPLEGLDLSPFVMSATNDDDYIYDLFAVSNHSGGLGGGHYTAYAKNFKNNQWYNFNDSSCTKVRDVSDIISPRAYQLFYRKRNSSIWPISDGRK
eukprot:GSMAST32.ASY1.ANO1.897.1 assembled CDS